MMIALLTHPYAMWNLIASLIAVSVGTYMLIAYGDEHNLIERAGLSLLCTGALLTCAPIAMKIYETQTPFDDWSGAMFRVGAAAKFVGWMWRRDSERWKAAWRRATRMSPRLD